MKKLIIIENVGQDVEARRKINEIINWSKTVDDALILFSGKINALERNVVEKVEQEPTCQHCSWCPDCDPKECNHIEPKTEGRECKNCHPEESKCECNATHHWTCPQHPSYRYSGSPKQDTWEEEAQRFMDRLSIFDLEVLNNIVYHKLQNQRQEIRKKFRSNPKGWTDKYCGYDDDTDEWSCDYEKWLDDVLEELDK